MLLGRILQWRGESAGAIQAFAAAERLMAADDATPERRANLAMLRGDFQRCADICDAALRAGGERLRAPGLTSLSPDLSGTLPVACGTTGGWSEAAGRWGPRKAPPGSPGG
jgi:hypothetical protein